MPPPARKPPVDETGPAGASGPADEKEPEDAIPLEAPRAPTEEAWAAMSRAQQDEAIAALLASETQEELDEREAMAEGDAHLDAKVEARDTLRAFFRKRGRRIYIGADIKVYHPGQKGFTPDVIAVDDAEPGLRNCWMVSREGRGVDLALEVHNAGDWSKDFVKNVKTYAALGIAEYFILDVNRATLKGYRLPSPSARVYRPIRPTTGRYRSNVLDLELIVEDGRLRFYAGTAGLATASEMVDKLERIVETAQTRAEQDQARIEQAEARMEQAMSQICSAILGILRLRGFAVDQGTEAQVLGCVDLEVLQRWQTRAMTVATVAEMFLDA